MTTSKLTKHLEGDSPVAQVSPSDVSMKHRVRPRMESQKCIWMDAESVEYQLCPLNQNCDQCDFNKEMMKRSHRPGYKTNPTFLQVRNPESSVIQFTPGLQFINRHFWIKRTGKGKVHLGMDAFMWQIFSSVQKILTPKLGTSLLQKQCFAWLQLEDDIIYLRTPVPGTILQVNPMFNATHIQDTHIYLSPEEDLWFVELALDESSFKIESLRKDEYLKLAKEDIHRFDNLLLNGHDEMPHALVRRSKLPKNAFSEYLREVSDSLAYIC